MTTNISYIDTSVTILDVVRGIDDATGNFFGAVLLLLIGVIAFVAMKNFDTNVVLISVSFITSIVAIFLYITGFIGTVILLIPMISLLVAIFLHMGTRN